MKTQQRPFLPQVTIRWAAAWLRGAAFLALALLPLSFAGADEPPQDLELLPPPDAGLTLESLTQLAMQNHPTLQRAQALVAAAQGNWVQVGLPFNPRSGYQGQQLGSGGKAEQHGWLVEQEVVRGGKLRLNRAVASREIAMAQQELQTQEWRVATDVRIAFYEVLVAQRRVELSNELQRIAREAMSVTERLRRVGEGIQADVVQAGLEVETAELQVLAAQNRRQAAWRSLRSVAGLPRLPETQLIGELEPEENNLTWETALDRLLSASPEIARAAAEVDRARVALCRAQVEPVPNLMFQGVLMQDQGIGGKMDSTLQLVIPIPVLDRNQGGIQRAYSEIVAAERALEQIELDLQNRLAASFERFRTSQQQVERYREKILPGAAEQLDLTRRAFQGAEIPFLNVLNAQRTFFHANLAYLEALRELRIAEAEIEGLQLRENLRQP